MLQNRKFAAISGYFTKFEISKKLFVIGLLTLLAIWNNAKINSEPLGTLGKFYLEFDKIAVFHNFLIFYVIPKNYGLMSTEVVSCVRVYLFNLGCWNTFKVKTFRHEPPNFLNKNLKFLHAFVLKKLWATDSNFKSYRTHNIIHLSTEGLFPVCTDVFRRSFYMPTNRRLWAPSFYAVPF